MNVADRIQVLRKQKGISQEELADKIGVSRQTISKWESEQSYPDIEKIIVLSDYFDVTTDYLLKGIEQEEINKKIDAKIFAIVGCLFNFLAIVCAIGIWKERQNSVSFIVGFILLGIGIIIYYIGQTIDTINKKNAKKIFWMISIWFIVLMPFSMCYNILQGLLQGYNPFISPMIELGNSFISYGIGWMIYFTICGFVVYLVAFRKGKGGTE